MLKNILKLDRTQKLSKKEQLGITGRGTFPTTEEACLNCGGNWSFPLCELPSNSVCLQH